MTFGARGASEDLASGVDPVQRRHGEIDHDDAGLQTLGHRNRFKSVGGLAEDFELLALEEGPQALPEDGVIVGK